MKKRLCAAGIVLALAIAIGQPFLYLSDFAGDAGIHLVYAENASAGAFFQYNRGEPSAGVTSLGYMLLLTALFFVLPPAAVPIAVKAIGIAGWYALLYLLFRLAADVFEHRGWAWLTLALVAAFPHAAHKATQGMENGLFAAVTVAWCLAAGRWGWFTTSRTVPARAELILGVLGGVALLLRPEAVVFLAMAVLCRVVLHARRPGDRRGALTRSAVMGVPVVLTCAAMVLFHQAFTGHLLPTTAGSRIMRTATASFFWGPFQVYPRMAAILGLVVLPVTILWFAGLAAIFSARSGARGGAVAVFASTLCGAYFIVYSGLAPAYHVPRYMIAMVPFFALGAALGTRWLLEMARGAPAGWLRRGGTAAAVALVAVLALVQARTSLVTTIRTMEEASFPTLMAFSRAPARRAETTRALLDDLERTPERLPVAVALHEVELRWFLDDRVRVYSLDGRTDSLLMEFVDREGTVDHAGWIRRRGIDYLLDTRSYNRDPAAWSLAELRKLRPGESTVHDGLRFVRRRRPPWLNESSWFRVQPESHPVIAVSPAES